MEDPTGPSLIHSATGWKLQREASTGKCPLGGSTTQEIRLQLSPFQPSSIHLPGKGPHAAAPVRLRPPKCLR